MIPRYSLPEMKKIWSEEERFKKMFDVELLACESLSKEGIVPRRVLGDIKRKAKIDVARIQEIEAVVKHDVIAFLEQIEERRLGEIVDGTE